VDEMGEIIKRISLWWYSLTPSERTTLISMVSSILSFVAVRELARRRILRERGEVEVWND